MKRVEMEADQMPGQDSFLDVITNIVGILILLVLVVGLRSSRAVRAAPNPQLAEQAQEKLHKAYNNAVDAQRNVVDLVHRVRSAHDEADFREEERLWLNTSIVKAEQEIAEIVPAEFAGIAIAAIERVDVHDLGENALVLVTDLERVSAEDARVIDLGIVNGRILPLGISRLTAEVGVTAGEFRRQAARDARVSGKSRNAV